VQEIVVTLLQMPTCSGLLYHIMIVLADPTLPYLDASTHHPD
jgi:hypothetical protein